MLKSDSKNLSNNELNSKFTQDELNTLGFNYKCCYSKKGEDLVKSIQKQGADCKCKTKKLVFLGMLNDIVNCYTIGTTITHKPDVPSYFSFTTDVIVEGDWFNMQIPLNELPELKINNLTFFNGNNLASPIFTNSSSIITWVNNEITSNLVNNFNSSTNINTFLIYSPQGLASTWNPLTIVKSNNISYTVNGTLQQIFSYTIINGENSIKVLIKLGPTMFEGESFKIDYTTEELNCLTEEQLTNIIEYINKQCDCCI